MSNFKAAIQVPLQKKKKKEWLNARFHYLIPDRTQKMHYLLSHMSEEEKLANEINPLTLKEKVKYLQISLN